MSAKEDGTRPKKPVDGKDEEESDPDEKALRKSNQMQGAMRTTAELWARDATPWQEEALSTSMLRLTATPASGTAKKKQARQHAKHQAHPKAVQARAYISWNSAEVDSWWDAVRASADAPTAEQYAFLQRIVTRCRQDLCIFRKYGYTSHQQVIN